MHSLTQVTKLKTRHAMTYTHTCPQSHMHPNQFIFLIANNAEMKNVHTCRMYVNYAVQSYRIENWFFRVSQWGFIMIISISHECLWKQNVLIVFYWTLKWFATSDASAPDCNWLFAGSILLFLRPGITFSKDLSWRTEMDKAKTWAEELKWTKH